MWRMWIRQRQRRSPCSYATGKAPTQPPIPANPPRPVPRRRRRRRRRCRHDRAAGDAIGNFDADSAYLPSDLSASRAKKYTVDSTAGPGEAAQKNAVAGTTPHPLDCPAALSAARADASPPPCERTLAAIPRDARSTDMCAVVVAKSIGRERQTFVAATLATHNDLAGPPVHVAQLQTGDLRRPQTQTRQHGQDGEVAKPGQRSTVAAVQQGRNPRSRQRRRQCRIAPARRRWHRLFPVAELEDVDVTVDEDVEAGLVLAVTAWCSRCRSFVLTVTPFLGRTGPRNDPVDQ